nr:S-layer homology domain-containing protein [Clostridia bacterium]
MRNMKKFLALVLAMMMMLSVAVFNTSAAEEADYTDAALFLNSLAVMQGSTDGDLMLDAGVERYQAALFFARCLTGKTETEIWNGTPASAYFTDVTMYGTAIDYAYGMGVVKGRGGNIFGATDKIIYQDMIVMAVRALGYETENMSYPWGHII